MHEYSLVLSEACDGPTDSEESARRFLIELERLCEITPKCSANHRAYVLVNAPLWKRDWARRKVFGLPQSAADAHRFCDLEKERAGGTGSSADCLR